MGGFLPAFRHTAVSDGIFCPSADLLNFNSMAVNIAKLCCHWLKSLQKDNISVVRIIVPWRAGRRPYGLDFSQLKTPKNICAIYPYMIFSVHTYFLSYSFPKSIKYSYCDLQ